MIEGSDSTKSYGESTIEFNYMTRFGDFTNFDCNLRDESIYELANAFRRFLLAAGFGSDLVNDVLGEES